TGRDSTEILNAVALSEPALLEYLDACIGNQDISGAREAWQRLLSTNDTFSLRDVLPYLDALIQQRELSELKTNWTLLGRRFPSEITAPNRDGNLVVNGSFEQQPANGGLDWRIAEIKGAEVSFDNQHGAQDSRALRIDFDATANPYYRHGFQYVQVQPNTRYRFSGDLRVQGITTETGPSFEIYDAYDMKKLFISGIGLTGTSEWSRQELVFRTPPRTELLIVRVARPPSQRIANQFGGTVWVDDVRLQPAE